MNPIHAHGRSLAALSITVVAAAGMAMAGGGTFEITSSTIDAGGGAASSASYELTSTTGQPDAAAELTSASFELAGGFWAGGGPADTPCDGDTNGDLVVNIDDIVNVVLDFGCTQPPTCPNGGDVNGDDVVDIDDIVFVILNFGSSCGI